MARDRFSNQKPRNYNDDIKYGKHTKMNHYVMSKRAPMSDDSRLFIVNLISKCKLDNDIKFLRSILAEEKQPTARQKKVIISIINKIE